MKFKWKWPLVWRKSLETSQAELKESQAETDRARDRNLHLFRQLDDLKHDIRTIIGPMCDKVMRVRVERFCASDDVGHIGLALCQREIEQIRTWPGAGLDGISAYLAKRILYEISMAGRTSRNHQ